MKQFYITSDNISAVASDPGDCYLSPTDPVHELKIVQYMDGLGSTAKLEEYRIKTTIDTIKQIQNSAKSDNK